MDRDGVVQARSCQPQAIPQSQHPPVTENGNYSILMLKFRLGLLKDKSSEFWPGNILLLN